jgi:branched-subunit amino acid ABC-type transport system permease component
MVAAMFLFLIASGLSLIFGVLGVLNFAHGSFYMFAAYLTWQIMYWIGPTDDFFWIAALAAATSIALISFAIERILFRPIYSRDHLYQLLVTYAIILVFADAARFIWGTGQLSISRPPSLSGSSVIFGTTLPHYNLFILILGFATAIGGWLILKQTHVGRTIRAAAVDREMLGVLGADVKQLYSYVFVVSSFFAGLAGALITPIKNIVPGMDVDIIVEAFIVVVIGGLGSLWGTFLGSVIYGQVLSFGILIFPRFSLFAVYLLMAVVLIWRPWGLLGRTTTR